MSYNQAEVSRWVRAWRLRNPELPDQALVLAVAHEFGIRESEARTAVNREALRRVAN